VREPRKIPAVLSERQKCKAILFRNGYASDTPEMLVEFRGLRRHGQERDAYCAIRQTHSKDQALRVYQRRTVAADAQDRQRCAQMLRKMRPNSTTTK
jgi:hypothetical protein